MPALNLFTNLYIKFKIVKQLTVELGGDAYFFTNYFAPDFVPQLNQFAVQSNSASKVKLGGYPFVDVYANLHLKRTRFFVMFSHVTAGNGNRMYFLTPHYTRKTGAFCASGCRGTSSTDARPAALYRPHTGLPWIDTQ